MTVTGEAPCKRGGWTRGLIFSGLQIPSGVWGQSPQSSDQGMIRVYFTPSSDAPIRNPA